jgi:regulator of protease activity HflC (stomatin/prohibitin superfamily)
MDVVTELIVAVIVAVMAIIVVLRSVWIVPQARAQNVERFGRYLRTLEAGLHFVIPFVDRVRPRIDLREQVVSFEPQPVITEDNLVVRIDTVLYFQVTDPRAAAYEIANYIQAIEQLTVTTLRNVIGAMDLEECLTSREKINSQLRIVLDEASGKWGIRVNRVEIKAIDPPPTIKEAMEKQMRAERDKRAAILNAEGVRQAKILTAEGEKQSVILNAEGARQSAVLRADGQAQAIDRVFTAVHRNDPDPKLLAYQYLQVLPELAKGEGNTFWVIPSEVTNALQGVSRAFTKDTGESAGPKVPPHEESGAADDGAAGPAALEAPRDRAAAAAKAAEEAAAEAHQEAEKAKADGRDALP